MFNTDHLPERISFGEFQLHLRTRELQKCDEIFDLQEQPFLVLMALLERPGQLVTRDELIKKLWPADTFVDFEHSLNKAVKRLREALADPADEPRFIETLPRRGYRFIGTLTAVSDLVSDLPGTQTTTELASQRPGASLPQTSRRHRAAWISALAFLLIASAVALWVSVRRGRNSHALNTDMPAVLFYDTVVLANALSVQRLSRFLVVRTLSVQLADATEYRGFAVIVTERLAAFATAFLRFGSAASGAEFQHDHLFVVLRDGSHDRAHQLAARVVATQIFFTSRCRGEFKSFLQKTLDDAFLNHLVACDAVQFLDNHEAHAVRHQRNHQLGQSRTICECLRAADTALLEPTHDLDVVRRGPLLDCLSLTREAIAVNLPYALYSQVCKRLFDLRLAVVGVYFQRCSRNRPSVVAGCALEGQCRRQDIRVSLSDGVGPTADTAQRSAKRSR